MISITGLMIGDTHAVRQMLDTRSKECYCFMESSEGTMFFKNIYWNIDLC